MPKSPNEINVENMRKRMHTVIDRTSPTMCSAKWLQTTTTLYNGMTHSCHHPVQHKVPLAELATNKTALHNTQHKKAARAEMLAGERPTECGYCWKIEDLPGDNFSDRTYKTTDENWSIPFIDRVLTAGAEGDILPTYFEVAFDSTCNFKCVYCSPDVSSKWMEEIEHHGPYQDIRDNRNLDWLRESGRFPIPNREANPYVDAFWEWWPELYPGLKTFRVTGGEPLLSKNMWRLLDFIKANPRKDFTLAINTNMQVPPALIDRFIAAYNEIAPLIGGFEVYTSCEAAGASADYIRYGMDYRTFLGNVERFLTETGPNSRIGFMVTFNVLSVTSFTDFLEDIYRLRAKFNESDAENRIPLMISYLRWPTYLDVRILPEKLKQEYLKTFVPFMMERTRDTSPDRKARFYLEEIDQVSRLSEYMMSSDPDVERNRQEFGSYVLQLDERRNTEFDKVFPHLSDFLSECIGL